MDVVLLSLALVVVLGASLVAAVVIPARRSGAHLINTHTVRRLKGEKPAARVRRRRRRNNVFVARQKQRPVDLTPLLSQGASGRSNGRRLTRAS
ncbi:hypothetical protein [Gephyromycinifex aptenodytis]|uniref:hypothetical protein n=1 Tax=Gephyromycinifex aptenodytis TaxID=2716227 RepID=UPI00144692A3|nr:hypothetical protein [Gephyromycinifex aptenodytis]